MENAKESNHGDKPNEENPNPNSESEPELESNPSSRLPSRAPFTSLSQVDADLALARTLQEQERAYMMLRMNGGDGSDYGSSDSGSYVYEDEAGDDPNDDGNNAGSIDDGEDAFDVHGRAPSEDELGVEIDPSSFDSDEAYARALQDAEEREAAVRLMALAGINDSWEKLARWICRIIQSVQFVETGLFIWGAHSMNDLDHGKCLFHFLGLSAAHLTRDLVQCTEGEADDPEDHGSNSQDTWQEVDPDELSYEELLALGEVVGTESRGLSADTIASLPSVNYKAQSSQDGSTDQCVICRLDYEDGDPLIVLSCKHSYHSECINNWLQINKVCPVCSAEVSTSESSQG